jgi:RNA polymerase sigma factor (sigma-70 family)
MDQVARWADDQELAQALTHLSLRERQAIYLHYYEDQTFSEADRRLGTREGTSRKMVSRALEKLRRRLTPDQEGPG